MSHRIKLIFKPEIGRTGSGARGNSVFVILLGNRNHKFDAVELVDLGCAGVIVNGHDVALGVHLSQALDNGLTDHMVRQARKGLCAYDIGRAGIDKIAHLGREQPTLAHGIAEGENLLGLLGRPYAKCGS